VFPVNGATSPGPAGETRLRFTGNGVSTRQTTPARRRERRGCDGTERDGTGRDGTRTRGRRLAPSRTRRADRDGDRSGQGRIRLHRTERHGRQGVNRSCDRSGTCAFKSVRPPARSADPNRLDTRTHSNTRSSETAEPPRRGLERTGFAEEGVVRRGQSGSPRTEWFAEDGVVRGGGCPGFGGDGRSGVHGTGRDRLHPKPGDGVHVSGSRYALDSPETRCAHGATECRVDGSAKCRTHRPTECRTARRSVAPPDGTEHEPSEGPGIEDPGSVTRGDLFHRKHGVRVRSRGHGGGLRNRHHRDPSRRTSRSPPFHRKHGV
jgi:hypothetical protein